MPTLDARRINDLLTIGGTIAAAATELLPIFPEGPVKQFIALILVFIAGVGRRGVGHEYQEVADAKAEAKIAKQVIASIAPPPISQEQIAAAIKASIPPMSPVPVEMRPGTEVIVTSSSKEK